MNYTTCIIGGAKRSGTTLMSRLLDSHSGVLGIAGDGWFWEHAFRYESLGCLDVYFDIFHTLSIDDLFEGIKDRDIIPFIDGNYAEKGIAGQFSYTLPLDPVLFKYELKAFANCNNINNCWDVILNAYAVASSIDFASITHVVWKGVDYGRSIISANNSLKNSKSIFIIRNPFYAIDSLKKSRMLSNRSQIHSFNLGEVIQDYLFFWKNYSELLQSGTLVIRYEDLLERSELVMKSIANHFEMQFSDDLLNPTLCSKKWHGNSSFKELTGIDVTVLDNKIRTLNDNEIDFIKKHLSGILENWDYSYEQQRPGGRHGI